MIGYARLLTTRAQTTSQLNRHFASLAAMLQLLQRRCLPHLLQQHLVCEELSNGVRHLLAQDRCVPCIEFSQTAFRSHTGHCADEARGVSSF